MEGFWDKITTKTTESLLSSTTSTTTKQNKKQQQIYQYFLGCDSIEINLVFFIIITLTKNPYL